MANIGVCYKLISKKEDVPCYLFPSLASPFETIGFVKIHENFKYKGIRITSPPHRIFTSSFMCQLIVEFFKRLNITRNELAAVHNNGVVVTCQGLFYGQLIIKFEKDPRFLVMLMHAQNPYFGFITSAFRRFVATHFKQYDGFLEQKLCPNCIAEFACNSEQIGIIEKGPRSQVLPMPPQLGLDYPSLIFV
jgi:hypothetical protein